MLTYSIPLVCLFLSLLFFLSLLRPKLAILICLALLPTYLLKLSLFKIPTTVLELSVYIAFVGAFFSAIILKRRNPKSEIRNPKQSQISNLQNSKLFDIWILNLFRASIFEFRILRQKYLFWPIAAFVAITFISAFLSKHLQITFGGWKAWIFDPILVFILMIYFFKTMDIWKIAAVLGISSAVLSIYGLLEYFLWPGQLGDGRLDSVFDPANYHALFVGPIIVLMIGFIFSPLTPRIWKFFLTAISAINILSLIFTFSYGGYLAVLGGLILFGILSLSNAWKKRVLFGGVAIFIIFILIASPTKKFQDLFEYKERSSGHARLEIWKTSWLIFKEHPILGIGLNDFEYHYRQTVPRVAFPPLEWLVAQPHNLYLALLAQIGLLGFAAFIWLVIYFSRLIKFIGHRSSVIGFTLLATMTTILLHGLVDTPYFKNDLAIIFWIIIALTVIQVKQDYQKPPNNPHHSY